MPDRGRYRFEVIDRTTLSFNALPNHRLGKHIARAHVLGHATCRVALVIGVDPLLALRLPHPGAPMALCGVDRSCRAPVVRPLG